MKKPTLAWSVMRNNTGKLWPLWMDVSRERLKSEIVRHGLERTVKIVRIEIREVKRNK